MKNLKDKKILIVDDEREIRIMIEKLFEKRGIFFVTYATGDCTSALSFCQTNNPDIAILDVMLPDGDGFSLLSSIRQFSTYTSSFSFRAGEDEDRLLGLGLGQMITW